jgi:hypothetical protein
MFIKLGKCFLNAVNEPSEIMKDIIIFDGELVFAVMHIRFGVGNNNFNF